MVYSECFFMVLVRMIWIGWFVNNGLVRMVWLEWFDKDGLVIMYVSELSVPGILNSKQPTRRSALCYQQNDISIHVSSRGFV